MLRLPRFLLLCLALAGCPVDTDGRAADASSPDASSNGDVNEDSGVEIEDSGIVAMNDAGGSPDVPTPVDAGAPGGDGGGPTGDAGQLPTDAGLNPTIDAGLIADAGVPMPQSDFSLFDVNPTSASYLQPVSPRDYLEKVSGWYFGHST